MRETPLIPPIREVSAVARKKLLAPYAIVKEIE